MDKSNQDETTLKLLVYQLNKYHLPRAQRMMGRLEQGEKLTDEDIQNLKLEYDESMKDWSLLERNPKYLDLGIRYVDLYTNIISRALKNEQAG